MIKFRYKRKETTTNNGGSNANTNLNGSTKNNKCVEIKSNDTNNKDDNNKPKALKCEAIDQPVHKPMTNIDTTQTTTIKTKTNIEQQYMEDCIRAIVVSEFELLQTGFVYSF